MRFLNKITFINSASIKYAEINLDGNVHFIGTQGVGKSTLLRAVLFFYNADKTKLGISREKKNFDSYYFPYQNSYIIFEVVKDHITFSVIAFKSNGRVAFRFMDSEYKKRYFINEEGATYESWDKIKAILKQETTFSKMISNYEEYRNILYGNNFGLDPDFKKYALLESKQYQNIPRTIQNVFLNTKLDAGFIKETIIKSLDEEVLKIDLSTYAHNHFKDFETELNDIQLWSKQNKQGEIVVRQQAEDVAKTYNALSVLDQEKINIARQLGWSIQSIQNKLPHLKQALNKEELKHQALSEQVNRLEEVFTDKSQEIKTQIGIVKKDIRKSKSKLKDYNSINIVEVLKRVSQKSALDIELQGLLEEKSLLTSEFSQTEQKYLALIDQLNNQKQKLSNEQANVQNQLESEFLKTKEELGLTYQKQEEEIRKNHQTNIDELEIKLSDIRQEEFNLSKQNIELKHKVYFEKELESYTSEQEKVKEQEKITIGAIEQAKQQITSIQKEWDFKLEQSQANIDIQIKKYQFEKDKTEQLFFKLQSKLESSKESLLDWLNTNVNNWTENIGKVIDEDKILFRKDLNPVFKPSSDASIYGLSIDLSNLDKPVKNLDEYTQDLQDTEQTLKTLEVQIQDLNVKKEQTQKQLKKTYNASITELKSLISTKTFELERLAQKLEQLTVQIKETISKAKDLKIEDQNRLELELSKITSNQELIKKQLNTLKFDISTLLQSKKDEKNRLTEQYYTAFKDKLNALNEDFNTKYQTFEQRIAQLKHEQSTELNDKGANTKRIAEIELSIVRIKKELNFIEQNRDKVAEYKKDKKELFDFTDQFKANKKELENKLVNETDKHQTEKEDFLEKEKSIKQTIDQFNYQIKQSQKDLEKFETFKKSEPFTHVNTFLSDFNDSHESALKASQLIEEINQNFYSVIKRYQDLQSAVNKFTGNFQEDNIFKFKTKFNSKQEYLQFADMLKEFIEEDKISILETRVNERFAHIIRQIGKETTGILSKEDEIQTIINKVNNDFFSKNFVGAIKSMQIRIMPSSNKIMRLLLDIKAFNDEHNMEVGGTNLFSSDTKAQTNQKAIKLVKALIKEMHTYKSDVITLSDSFGLEFRILENDNDTGWVEKLSNVGSEGTDILVKAMINIMLLNVFKENASKRVKNFKLHCMMDEIGKLHPTNVKGILKFANDRNILLINSSPTSYNATDYKYTYLLSKDYNNVTRAKRLVKKTPTLLDV